MSAFKPFDIIIAIPALGLVIASFFHVYGISGGRPAAVIRADGGEWVFPMDTAENKRFSGPLGETLVELGVNSARIVSSPCRNQVCVAAGFIRAPGQWSACLPNRVMVYIREDKNNEVDAATW